MVIKSLEMVIYNHFLSYIFILWIPIINGNFREWSISLVSSSHSSIPIPIFPTFSTHGTVKRTAFYQGRHRRADPVGIAPQPASWSAPPCRLSRTAPPRWPFRRRNVGTSERPTVQLKGDPTVKKNGDSKRWLIPTEYHWIPFQIILNTFWYWFKMI